MVSPTFHVFAVACSTLVCQIHSRQIQVGAEGKIFDVRQSVDVPDEDYNLDPPPPSTRVAELRASNVMRQNEDVAESVVVVRTHHFEVSRAGSPSIEAPVNLGKPSKRGQIRHQSEASKRGASLASSFEQGQLNSYSEVVDSDWFQRQGEVAQLRKRQNASSLLDDGTRNVWIQSLPRTGSSALMSFLSLAEEDQNVFGIYEPCFPTDAFRGQPQNARVCPEVLSQLQRCKFDEIGRLHSWNYSCGGETGRQWNACDGHNHMSLHSHDDYAHAAEDCSNAKLRLWKTTTMPIDMNEALDKGVANLRVINLVRDPRATLASALKLWGQDGKPGRWTNNSINDPKIVCKELNRRWMDHPRVHHVRFEDMVSQPTEFFAQVYDFLDLPLLPRTKTFINGHFGNERCVEVLNNNCRKRPEERVDAWRQVPQLVNITSKMQESPQCVEFFNKFGYKF